MNSPVQLANYRVKKLNFEIIADFEELKLGEASFKLDVDYEVFDDNNNQNKHKVDLFVQVIPSTEEEVYLPFEVEVVLQGIFLFEENIDDEEKLYHLNISCPSMLYGIARNLVHQMTGQTNYGNISIPSVQFSQIAREKSQNHIENEDIPTANSSDD